MADCSPSRQRTVTLSYANTGTVPPVFVAGSFSSPPWQPLEMAVAKQLLDDGGESGEYEFRRDVTVSEGTWQYKFRLGHGDWWVLDDGAEKTTDDAGNINNIMVIKPHEPAVSAAPHQAPSSPSPASDDVKSKQSAEAASATPPRPDPQPPKDTMQLLSSEEDCNRADAAPYPSPGLPDDFEDEHTIYGDEDLNWTNSAPMLPHELITDHASPLLSDHLPDLLEEDETGLGEGHEHDNSHHQAGSPVDDPVLPHGQISFSLDPPTPTDAPMRLPSEEVTKLILGPSLEDSTTHAEDIRSDNGSPLLSPSGSDGLVTEFLDNILHADDDEDTRIEHAPLFAYECMSGCDEVNVQHSAPPLARSPLLANPANPIDVDISTLEEFPSDRERVFKFIEDAEARLSEDITSDDESKLSSPAHMPATPVDTYFSHQHLQRPSPKGEQTHHLAQIPEEYVLPDLALDVPSPTRIAFNVQPSEGIILDQDGLFDVPRRMHSYRRASNDWADTKPTLSAHESGSSTAEADVAGAETIAPNGKNTASPASATIAASVAGSSAAEIKRPSDNSGYLSSNISGDGIAVQKPASNDAAQLQNLAPGEHTPLPVPTPLKAVVSFHQGDLASPSKAAHFDGAYDLFYGLRSRAQRPK